MPEVLIGVDYLRPGPAGMAIPTKEQWNYLVSTSSLTVVGNFDIAMNYDTAVVFTDKVTLIKASVPHGGYGTWL